jgi:4-amino-4-deoxy-L-arabinose transferase-like glycosyltransferase
MNIFDTKTFDRCLCTIENLYYLFLTLIMITSFINIFYNIGTYPFNSWDEARHGVNAYEMIKRNNYIINTYSYKDDYWNLKPPLGYWLIVLGYRIFGFNALGLRFFSAIAALVTIAAIAYYTLLHYGKLSSLISTAVLTTTTPFILDHCARSGDADALFVMFFTLSMLSISLTHRNRNYLYASGLFFALAFLSKSWHSGNILIIIFIYLLLTLRYNKLSHKDILIFFICCAFPIMIWALLRFNQDGFSFFKHMVGYDLIARTTSPLEGHTGTIFYYIEVLQKSYFYWFLVFMSTLLCGTSLLTPINYTVQRRANIYLFLLWILIPFMVFTKASTKIYWYILPIYPAFAISIGAITIALLKSKNRNLLLQLSLSFMLLFSLYKNETNIINSIINLKVDDAQELIKETANFPELKNRKIYIHHFEQSYWLCAELYNDLIPVDGGIDGFINDPSEDALLFITKDRKELQDLNINKLNILLQNKAAYIFTK